jgi:hypothetical protein
MYMYPTVCLLRYDRVALPKVPQSKSLDEISLNPLAPRDRQSTLRFEKSISAGPSEKKNLGAKLV